MATDNNTEKSNDGKVMDQLLAIRTMCGENKGFLQGSAGILSQRLSGIEKRLDRIETGCNGKMRSVNTDSGVRDSWIPASDGHDGHIDNWMDAAIKQYHNGYLPFGPDFHPFTPTARVVGFGVSRKADPEVKSGSSESGKSDADVNVNKSGLDADPVAAALSNLFDAMQKAL